ncbi:MAG: tetratricopeptide repeat protein [Bryobacteraceae bacterium]
MARRKHTGAPAAVAAPAAGKAASQPASSHRWMIAVLLAAAFLAYSSALDGPFLFDDRGFQEMLASSPSWKFLAARIARSVTNISFLAESAIAGIHPKSFHFTNIALHLLNGFLVWRILETLLALRGSLSQTDRLAAAAGAGFYLLHPLQTEAVAYISSRSEVLCALFAYSSFLLFLRSREITFPRALAITALLALSALSKEPGVAMAGVFLLFDLLLQDPPGFRSLLRRWKLYVPLLAAASAVGIRLYLILSREGTAGTTGKNKPLDYLLTQFEVIWQYFRLVVLPVGQNLDHAWPVAKAPGDAGVWAGAAALACLLAVLWRYRKQYPLALFGLLFLLVLLAPTSSIVPIDDAMAERRLYLGSPGVAMIAVEFLRRLRPAAIASGAAAVLLLLGALTWQRAKLYTAAIPMWEDSVAVNPKNSRAWFHLGFAYYEQGRCADAARAYEKAASTAAAPDYQLLVNWATALECSGRMDEAIARIREADRLEHRAQGLAILGRIYAKQGRLDEALEVLNEALRLDPMEVNALVFRGNVYLLRNQPAEALSDYEQALGMNPSDSAAIVGRQSALRALGRSR